MKTTIILSMAAVLTSIAFGASADSGETAVTESRTALKELWGRAPAQQQTAAAARQDTAYGQSSFNAHIADRRSRWSNNFAAGRKHEPADHDGR